MWIYIMHYLTAISELSVLVLIDRGKFCIISNPPDTIPFVHLHTAVIKT